MMVCTSVVFHQDLNPNPHRFTPCRLPHDLSELEQKKNQQGQQVILKILFLSDHTQRHYIQGTGKHSIFTMVQVATAEKYIQLLFEENNLGKARDFAGAT